MNYFKYPHDSFTSLRKLHFIENKADNTCLFRCPSSEVELYMKTLTKESSKCMFRIQEAVDDDKNHGKMIITSIPFNALAVEINKQSFTRLRILRFCNCNNGCAFFCKPYQLEFYLAVLDAESKKCAFHIKDIRGENTKIIFTDIPYPQMLTFKEWTYPFNIIQGGNGFFMDKKHARFYYGSERKKAASLDRLCNQIMTELGNSHLSQEIYPLDYGFKVDDVVKAFKEKGYKPSDNVYVDDFSFSSETLFVTAYNHFFEDNNDFSIDKYPLEKFIWLAFDAVKLNKYLKETKD